MIDFNMGQLRAFRAVLEEGTFEAAARSLHVTPSAISQRLKALETTVGRVLLQRTKPVTPTESGEAILLLAQQVELASGEAARRLHTDFDDGTPATISLAVNADSLATWVMPALARIAGQMRFEIHREDEDFTVGLLQQGRAMAAITSVAEPVTGCRSFYLGTLRYRAMATQAFKRKWFKTGFNSANLANAPVMAFDRSDQLQQRFLSHYSPRRPLQPPVFYIPSTTEYAGAVQLGIAWGLIPEIQHLPRRTELVDLDNDHVLDVKLYWQQWRLPSAYLDTAAATIRAEGRRVLL